MSRRKPFCFLDRFNNKQTSSGRTATAFATAFKQHQHPLAQNLSGVKTETNLMIHNQNKDHCREKILMFHNQDKDHCKKKILMFHDLMNKIHCRKVTSLHLPSTVIETAGRRMETNGLDIMSAADKHSSHHKQADFQRSSPT